MLKLFFHDYILHCFYLLFRIFCLLHFLGDIQLLIRWTHRSLMFPYILWLARLSILTFYWLSIQKWFNWFINFVVHWGILQKVWTFHIFRSFIFIICEISLTIPYLFEFSHHFGSLIFLENFEIKWRLIGFVFWKICRIFCWLSSVIFLLCLLHIGISLYYTHYK